MNRRVLVAIPLALMFAYLAGAIGSHANPWFFTVEIPLLKFLAFAGCMAAMVRYGRSDYLFWAWLLLGVDYGTLCLNDLLLGRRIHLLNVNDEHLADLLRTTIIVISNIAAAVSSVMMARTWRVAGLGLPSSAWQRIVVAGGILLAIGVVGYITWPDLKAALHGEAERRIVPIAANLGDLICFCVIAPLFLQAVALRGGRLAWPWAFIVAADIAWMLFDVLINLEGFEATTVRILGEACRTAACASTLAAGLAQRWATRAQAD